MNNIKTVDLTVCWLQAAEFTLTKERAVGGGGKNALLWRIVWAEGGRS